MRDETRRESVRNGCSREVSCICASGRDVQPALERARPTCRALFSSGRFDRERACVGREALVQDPQAVPCEELRLGDLVILSRPAVARGERIGGGPIHHARLTELERLAGPSAPGLVPPQLAFDLTPAHFVACRAAYARARASSTELDHGRWHTPRDRKGLNSQDRSQLLHHPVLAFANSAVARHPQDHARWFLRESSDEADRIACATARMIASPHQQGTFTVELPPAGSPQTGVDYDYAGKQPIPATGLAPARHTALWAANGSDPQFRSGAASRPVS